MTQVETGNELMLKYRPRRVLEIYRWEYPSRNVLLLSPGGVLRFNAVGSYLWELLDGTRLLGEVVDLVRAQFAESEGIDVRADVIDLLKDLDQKKLITIDWDPLS